MAIASSWPIFNKSQVVLTDTIVVSKMVSPRLIAVIMSVHNRIIFAIIEINADYSYYSHRL
jgi:hypothetical protein